MKIIGARLKPIGGPTEYILRQYKIKDMLEEYVDDKFDFIIDDNGKKFVQSFGFDNVNPVLVGKTLEIVNDRVKVKFNEDGTISVISKNSPPSQEGKLKTNEVLTFDNFKKRI